MTIHWLKNFVVRHVRTVAKKRRNHRSWQPVEALESRRVPTTGITANLTGGVLYVYGTDGDDNIQVKFANHQIQVLDAAKNEAAGIKLTQGGVESTVRAIDRDVVPYYVFVQTGAGNNRVNVAESTLDSAKPMVIYGGLGNDSLSGGSADDVIAGLYGIDTVSGGKGNDTLYTGYGSGPDVVPAGSTEYADGGDGNDTIVGAAGKDIISGGSGNDSISGMAGNDSLTGGAGNDRFSGGLGNDTIAGDGDSDTLIDSYCSATLSNTSLSSYQLTNSKFETDTLSSIEFAELTAVPGTYSYMSLVAVSFTGGLLVYGSEKPDNVSGGSGNDTIYGYGGADQLVGNRGNDSLYGGTGDDSLFGREGIDALFGEEGVDTIVETYYSVATLTDMSFNSYQPTISANEADTLVSIEKAQLSASPYGVTSTSLQAGSFTGGLLAYGSSVPDYINGGSGNDSLYGYGGADQLYGNGGNDTLDGGSEGDTLVGGIGADSLNGNTGNDVLLEWGLIAASLKDSSLASGRVVPAWDNQTDTLASIEKAQLYGAVNSGGGVWINASDFTGSVELYGTSQPDTLIGARGNDRLFGYGGNDTLEGQSGNDYIDGGADLDTLKETGLRSALLKDTSFAYERVAPTWDGQTETIVSIEKAQLFGAVNYGGGTWLNASSFSGDVSLFGTSPPDTLFGGRGNDRLYGDGGSDRLEGQSGNDELHGGDGNDILIGGDNLDSLYGEGNDDWLEAGSAAEFTDGGSGTDYNAHIWEINGATAADIKQQQASTCVFMSALAATSKYRDLATRITYEGNFTYAVQLFDPSGNHWESVRVRFDGTIVSDSAGKVMDPASASEGEFWTILHQRAYLQRFRGVDPMNGDAVVALGGESDGRAMAVLIADSVDDDSIKASWFLDTDVGPSWLADKARTELVCAAGTGHCYMVDSVVGDGRGGWQVRLYNPWGFDASHNGMAIIADSVNDGFITISWSTFQNKLTTVLFT